ncbi:MAG: hypothetical protein KBT44_04780 [Bacteroidales bacterium]|nr:hypothetical protein [Candidatus Equibacterium intestinale]
MVAVRNKSQIKGSTAGTLKWDMTQMTLLPKVLGSANPLHYANFLPGVTTSAEPNAGVHMLGCEDSHNDITLNGAPVYGASHLFGIFSVFNATHYPSADIDLHPVSPSRLGGNLDMTLPDKPEEDNSGEFSVGLITSEGTLRMKTGDKSSLLVSGRGSYLSRIYGNMLTVDGNHIDYSFGDMNLSWIYRPSESDRIWVDAYCGKDTGAMHDAATSAEVGAGWGNVIGTAGWQHKEQGYALDQRAYYSRYKCTGAIDQDVFNIELPSSIESCGYKARWRKEIFSAGLDAALHRVVPQCPIVDGKITDITGMEVQRGIEIVPGASFSGSSGLRFTWKAGAWIPIYVSPDNGTYIRFSPHASAAWNFHGYGKIQAGVSLRHQNIFQTGFSNIGLPLEFRFLAGKHIDPQSALCGNIAYGLDLAHGMYRLDFDVYASSLKNQIGYGGTIFDLLNVTYDLDSNLLKGSGLNYGASVMASKRTGKLTGWISYSYSRALRHFEALSSDKFYPADHERPHEIDAVLAWKLNAWDFGGTFVAASGTPVTHPDFLYISSGQIIASFKEHNSGRMRPYIRLDLSAGWNRIKTPDGTGGINLSVYNALGRENDFCYRLFFNGDGFRYGYLRSFMRFIPSLSLFYKFK